MNTTPSVLPEPRSLHQGTQPSHRHPKPFRATRRLGLLALAIAFLTGPLVPSGRAQLPAAPRISEIQVDARSARVSVLVPAGLRRIVLESTRRDQPEGWEPRLVRRLDGSAQTLVLELPADARHELLRVRAEETDPLEAAFYTGTTNIPAIPLAGGGPLVFRGGGVVDLDTAAPGNQNPTPTEGAADRTIVESDIWKLAGTRLHFFNQYRGLQTMDVSQPDQPRLLGTLSFPSSGEQLYVPDEDHVVLLLREDCRGNGYSGAAIAIIDVSTGAPREVARLAIPGRLFESRMIGDALYVASQTYEATDADRGVWEMATVISSFDLAQPATPVARGLRRIPGAASVVAAGGSFFFVGLEGPWTGSARSTQLHVLDVSDPAGSVAEFATLRLPGYLRDKFKINLLDDVLRVVVEGQESTDRWSPVTRLTTWRLARDGKANYQALGKLDLGAGENLFGTRFDGTRAYVVTYRRVDPLWIIDLSDPTRPAQLGELHIPGWSNYLHPLGDRLLTVGIDDTAGWRAAVQLFDVSNPAKPNLLAKVPLGDTWSSSEANWDEKALGVFPEEGLVLIPFAGSDKESFRQGVQVIDLGRDTLKARGVIEHDTFAPRRSTVVGPRVLSLSSRELLTADLADRDAPRITAHLDLSRPVDRLVVAGDSLITFSGTDLQTAPRSAPDAVASRLSLGKLPVVGAVRDADRLLVLQGVPASVSWTQTKPDGEWTASTNTGILSLRVLSLAALPKVTELGVTETDHALTYLGSFDALWPNPGTLVWASQAGQGIYGPWVFLDAVAPVPQAGAAAPGLVADRRFWFPWGWGQPRALVAFDVADPSQPSHRSTLVSASAAASAGEAFRGDGLVLFSEEFQESTVTGTNEVVWTESYYTPVADPLRPDKETLVLSTRQVTNLVPIVQWWQRHELRVVDYSAGGREPVVRPTLAFPGELRGVARGGSLLFSVANRPDNPTNGVTRQILEASAYDGVSLFVQEGITLTRNNDGNARAHVLPSGHVAVTLASWSTPATNQLQVYELDGTRLVPTAKVSLEGQPRDTVLRGNTLLIREPGTTELWDLTRPATPTAVPAVDHGCVWYELPRTEGSNEVGWWAPGGEYGVLFLGPR